MSVCLFVNLLLSVFQVSFISSYLLSDFCFGLVSRSVGSKWILFCIFLMVSFFFNLLSLVFFFFGCLLIGLGWSPEDC